MDFDRIEGERRRNSDRGIKYVISEEEEAKQRITELKEERLLAALEEAPVPIALIPGPWTALSGPPTRSPTRWQVTPARRTTAVPCQTMSATKSKRRWQMLEN